MRRRKKGAIVRKMIRRKKLQNGEGKCERIQQKELNREKKAEEEKSGEGKKGECDRIERKKGERERGQKGK